MNFGDGWGIDQSASTTDTDCGKGHCLVALLRTTFTSRLGRVNGLSREPGGSKNLFKGRRINDIGSLCLHICPNGLPACCVRCNRCDKASECVVDHGSCERGGITLTGSAPQCQCLPPGWLSVPVLRHPDACTSVFRAARTSALVYLLMSSKAENPVLPVVRGAHIDSQIQLKPDMDPLQYLQRPATPHRHP